MSERVIRVAALLAVVVAAAGCGGGHGVLGARTTICSAGSRQAVGSERVAWAAVVVRPTNALIARSHREEVPPDPTTRKCSECLSEIPIDARRCAFCTSVVRDRA